MIILPMAGLGDRFSRAGYALPKFMLPLGDATVFAQVLRSFKAYFSSVPFLFICRNVMETPDFIAKSCRDLGIAEVRIITLTELTRGQAETVWLGLKQAVIGTNVPITIFNIDTIRPGFHYPPEPETKGMDGFLEVFRGVGDAWSFAKTRAPDDKTVVETAEKRRISDLCSTGLYHFARAGDFLDAFEKVKDKSRDSWDAHELYVAPLYNLLIQGGKKIFAVEIPAEDMIPCGMPDEYEAAKQNWDRHAGRMAS